MLRKSSKNSGKKNFPNSTPEVDFHTLCVPAVCKEIKENLYKSWYCSYLQQNNLVRLWTAQFIFYMQLHWIEIQTFLFQPIRALRICCRHFPNKWRDVQLENPSKTLGFGGDICVFIGIFHPEYLQTGEELFGKDLEGWVLYLRCERRRSEKRGLTLDESEIILRNEMNPSFMGLTVTWKHNCMY